MRQYHGHQARKTAAYVEKTALEDAKQVAGSRGPFSRGPFPPKGSMPTSFAYKHRFLAKRKIPKSGGRFRTILVPRGKLREAQDLALDYLQHCYGGRYGISLMHCQTAFKRGCNAYENAERHAPYSMSVKFDIKDFFDSIPGFPRKARKIAAHFAKQKEQRRRSGKATARRSRYRVDVLSVYECLVREGIDEDIARWITDIGTVRGYLYQGSPLSPLLSNLVTKHNLAKKMIKLGTTYDLPIFKMFQDWYMVLDYSGQKVWYYGTELTTLQCKMVQRLINDALAFPAYRSGLPFNVKVAPRWDRMVPADGESVEDMLVRYGQRGWSPRRASVVAKFRKYMSRSHWKYDPNKPPLTLNHRDIQHHPLGKTVFTLYADDGVFSSNNKKLYMIRHVIRRVVEDCGFRINTKKSIRVMRRSRYITGYQVCAAGPDAKDTGTRIDSKTRAREYRAWLDHVRKGKRVLDEGSIYHFEGKLAYLKLSNPNWWKIYAVEFRELLLKVPPSSSAALLATTIAERYKHL